MYDDQLNYIRNVFLTAKLYGYSVDDVLRNVDEFAYNIGDFDNADCQRDLDIEDLLMLEKYGIKVHWEEISED